MRICRTLDYIVNTDLHLYLFAKFDDARNKGLQIEIKLIEPITCIPIDTEVYIEIIDLILSSAIESAMKSLEKKLLMYMYYVNDELHLAIQYFTYETCISNNLDKVLRRHNNAYCYTIEEMNFITHHLVVESLNNGSGSITKRHI